MRENPLVSIIIISWNGIEELKELLPTIESQTFKNYEVIIIDNGSTDGSQQFLEKKYPHYKLIKLDKNYGFAEPNNIGFKKSKSKYILTLNNDIILPKNFLGKLVDFAEKAPENVYSIGCKMIFHKGKRLINSVGISPLINGNGVNIGKNEKPEKYNKSMEIYGPCAGAALYKAEIIKKVGGLFDPSYFAYLEDLELAHRAQKKGFKALFCPDAYCYHKHSVTSSRFPFTKLYLIERNRLINLAKHYPWYYLLAETFFTLGYLVKSFSNKKDRKKIGSDQKLYFKTSNLINLAIIFFKARFYLLNYLWKKL